MNETIDQLMDDSEGRRWIRLNVPMDQQLADRLLQYREDFQTTRRDRSLELVVAYASLEALLDQQSAILAGPAAAALWRRIAADTDQLVEIATEVARHGSPGAASAAVGILLLDPIRSFDLTEPEQVSIAAAALDSDDGTVRGLAAEYLADHRPAELAERINVLAADSDPRARAFAWDAAFRLDSATAFDHAIALLGDESLPVWQRRSALTAAGERMPAEPVIELLAFFVLHPDESLAMDAARLFHDYHRHPTIAEAALQSPHPEVREIGARLMDPYRGSPAAGGSRPGDPTSSDVFAEMLRRLGEESEN